MLKLNVLHPDKVRIFCKILIIIAAMNLIQANNEGASHYKNPKKAFYYSIIPGLGQVTMENI